MASWPPSYTISRNTAASFDKILSVLTPPWLRGSGCWKPGRGWKVKKKGNFKSSAEMSGTQSCPCLHRAFQNWEQPPSNFKKKKKRLHQHVKCMQWLFSLTETVPDCSHSTVSLGLICWYNLYSCWCWLFYFSFIFYVFPISFFESTV